MEVYYETQAVEKKRLCIYFSSVKGASSEEICLQYISEVKNRKLIRNILLILLRRSSILDSDVKKEYGIKPNNCQTKFE
jgi:hypothetical protein